MCPCFVECRLSLLRVSTPFEYDKRLTDSAPRFRIVSRMNHYQFGGSIAFRVDKSQIFHPQTHPIQLKKKFPYLHRVVTEYETAAGSEQRFDTFEKAFQRQMGIVPTGMHMCIFTLYDIHMVKGRIRNDEIEFPISMEFQKIGLHEFSVDPVGTDIPFRQKSHDLLLLHKGQLDRKITRQQQPDDTDPATDIQDTDLWQKGCGKVVEKNGVAVETVADLRLIKKHRTPDFW